jgi:hypothetical protein
MQAATPEQIIEAFDHILVYIYGASYARDNPNKTDLETATRWADEGLDLVTASCVFFDRMSWMHEKHLRWHDKGDRTNVPGSLKVFDENIEAAIRRVATGSGDMDEWERSDSQWRARVKMFVGNRYWLEDHWGAPPGQPGCRVPQSIMREFDKKAA